MGCGPSHHHLPSVEGRQSPSSMCSSAEHPPVERIRTESESLGCDTVPLKSGGSKSNGGTDAIKVVSSSEECEASSKETARPPRHSGSAHLSPSNSNTARPSRDWNDQPSDEDRGRDRGGTTPNENLAPTTTTEENSLPKRQSNDDDDDDPPRKKKKPLFRRSSSVLEGVIEDRNNGDPDDIATKVVHIELASRGDGQRRRTIEDVYDGVHDGPVLGEGVSGVVRLVSHRSTGVQYAVKVLNVAEVRTEEGLRQLREEICVMCELDHPNIVRLEEVYESSRGGTAAAADDDDDDDEKIYLVQELCAGRELFDRLEEQPEYRYEEGECARLVGQMLSAVRFMHSKGIVHRDLKLENFLFSSDEESEDIGGGELRMIDFGLSKHFGGRPGQCGLHETVGTPYTVAPEVLLGRYDERCDLWAIGVLAFLLLCGETPFGGCGDGSRDSPAEIRDNILRGTYAFEPAEVWDGVSDEAKDFVRGLLVLDPAERLTAEEAQRTPWIRNWGSRRRSRHRCDHYSSSSTSSSEVEEEEKDQMDDRLLDSEVVSSLLEFREYTDVRKLLCEVLSFTLLPSQIDRMRREFRKLDSDGLGEISYDDFRAAIALCSLDDADVVVAAPGCRSSAADGRRRSSFPRPLRDEEIEAVFAAVMRRHHQSGDDDATANDDDVTRGRIHWHEFVAAALSQCDVDDRNLRLAFDRLDADHKGYVSFDDVLDLSGRGREGRGISSSGSDSDEEEEARRTKRAAANVEAMRGQWAELMRTCRLAGGNFDLNDDSSNGGDDDGITYEDFAFLMNEPKRIRPLQEAATINREEDKSANLNLDPYPRAVLLATKA